MAINFVLSEEALSLVKLSLGILVPFMSMRAKYLTETVLSMEALFQLTVSEESLSITMKKTLWDSNDIMCEQGVSGTV